MAQETYSSCPACGAALKNYNPTTPEMRESWEFACDGCLFRNEAGEIEVNWECKGTCPLQAALLGADPAAVERERCAQIADQFAVASGTEDGEVYIARKIASRIRDSHASAAL